jgi:GT2 family glycosyltransferase/glycosyltransferase involved in cell wall biosynthesis/SAM-dependent methyltransferase
MHDSENPVPAGANTDPENDLSFTGERVIPGKVEADLFNEHFVRYVYAREFCGGQKVLDTGCGVGYGSAHVAEVASCVVGLDNDARAVGYARSHYSRSNVRYLVGDSQALPFQSQAFDVVTSFELIEHLPDAGRYLEEIRRVLKQSGTLVVSTPNRPVYHEHLGDTTNPFHIREWDLEEFLALLKTYFKVVEPLGEQHLSAVGILGPASNPSVPVTIEQRSALASADYFVCVCSDRALKVGEMVYVPASANVLSERERHIRSLTRQLNDRETYLARLQPEFEEKAAWANKLNAELAESQRLVHQFRLRAQELESRARELQSKADELGVLWSRATRWKRALIFSVLAPMDWIIGSVIIAAELFGRVLRKMSSRKAPLVAPQNSAQCSIVIVTWEGKELLAESLPALLEAVRFHGGEHEIVVVDNGSTDGTEEYLQNYFPEVRVIRNQQNEYFGGGNNLGVQAAKNDVVVLLNNDMIVHKDFLGPLLEGFQTPDVFAIASQVFLADPHKPREETGKTRATFNGCDLDWRHDPISRRDEEQDYVPVLWGHGGAVAVDRQKFLWLGGFDRLYDPFYVEDADLSYQAWKVGWRSLLGVRSKVIHKHRSSTSRFGSQFITQIVRRNHELFIWKNFGDVPKLLKHFVRAFRRRIRQAGVPGIGIRLELRALLGAAERLPGVLSRRLRLARSIVCTDQEILDITNPPNVPSSDGVYFSRSDSEERPDHSDNAPGQRRILMVCAYMPCLGVHSGGSTMFNLIRTLSKRYRLTVLSFYEKESEHEFVPMLSRYCERLELVYRGQSLDAPNPFGLKPPEVVYEFYNKRMQRLVAQHLQTGLFDVLQCEFLQTGHFAYVDPNVPAVLTNHELLSLSYLNSLKNIPWTSPLRKTKAMIAWMKMLNYEEKLSRRFAAVVVLTRPEREFLSRYAPTIKVYDHATGVDCIFFSPKEEPSEKGSVVFVGNFRHSPNVGGMMWFLQNVWPAIRASYPGAGLHIVGGNPPVSIQEAHGRDGITVTGWVEDVRPYLQRASVFVAPVFEGVGLRGKVLEAWAMKKAVVGTHLSFEALNARDGENCFVADDAELFARRVCSLLENPELAIRMGEAARQLVVDAFSWDAFGEVYDKIYSEILEPREGSRLSSHSPVLKQEVLH